MLARSKIKTATYGREPYSDVDVGTSLRATVAAAASSAASAAVEVWEAAHGMGDGEDGQKVDPEVVERIYRDFIIPVTKEVEVEFLFRRCGVEVPEWGGLDQL